MKSPLNHFSNCAKMQRGCKKGEGRNRTRSQFAIHSRHSGELCRCAIVSGIALPPPFSTPVVDVRWCGVTPHATGVGGGGRKEETPLFLGERPNNGGSKITAFREQKGRDPHTARRSSYKTFLSHVRTCIALSAQGDFFPLLPIYTSRSPLSRPIALKQRREGGRERKKRSIMYSRIFSLCVFLDHHASSSSSSSSCGRLNGEQRICPCNSPQKLATMNSSAKGSFFSQALSL